MVGEYWEDCNGGGRGERAEWVLSQFSNLTEGGGEEESQTVDPKERLFIRGGGGNEETP